METFKENPIVGEIGKENNSKQEVNDQTNVESKNLFIENNNLEEITTTKTNNHQESILHFYSNCFSNLKKILRDLQEIILIFTLLFVPFFSLSYMNLFNLFCGLLLVMFILNVKHYAIFKIRKIILIVLVLSNLIEIFTRTILYFLFNKGVLDYLENTMWSTLNKYLNIYAEDFSKASYHFLISILINLILILYHIFKRCNSSGYNYTDEYIFNIKSLKAMHNIRYFLLFFSYLLICLSSCLHQNFLFLIFVSLVMINMAFWVFRLETYRKITYKLTAYILYLSLFFVILGEYLINLPDLFEILYNDEDYKFWTNLVGGVFFYEKNLDMSEINNKNPQDKYTTCSNNFFSIMLYEIVLVTISTYIKCSDYKLKVRNYTKKDKSQNDQAVKKRIVKKNSKTNDNLNLSDDSIYYVKSINNTNENFILIVDEKQNKGFFQKLRKIIKDYIYSPYFTIHFCRVGIILWFSYFKAYLSIIFILWLFRSFMMNKSNDIYSITKYIVFPLLIISTYLTFIINIQGIVFLENSKENEDLIRELGMTKYSSKNIVFWALLLKFLVTYIFGIYLYIHKGVKENENKLNEVINRNNYITASNSINDSGFSDNYENCINSNFKEPLINSSHDLEHNKNLVNQTQKYEFTYILKSTEIFLKLLLSNMNLVTMFFMYLVAFRYVNLFHLILVIIFLIQLTKPRIIIENCTFFIIILEIIVFTEYIWIFIENKINISENILEILNFIFVEKINNKIENTILITDNLLISTFSKNYNDQLLLGALYCLYIEQQNYSSQVYEIYKYKKINMYEYINFNFPKNQKFQKIMANFFDFVTEIYIWVLFFGYFSTIVFIETSILSGIKLITFFVVISKYLQILESNYSEASNILKYIKVLITISITLSLLIYFYQYLELEVINDIFQNYIQIWIPNFIRMNAKNIGFNFYKEDMKFKFIPHCASNLISVMIFLEVERIILNKKFYKKQSSKEDNNMGNSENKAYETNFKRYFYKFLFYILKYYWICIFFAIFLISVKWRLSVSMLILQIIFLYKVVKCFSDYFSNFMINSEKLKYLTNFNSILKAYSEEKGEHFKLAHYYRTRSFKIIWVFVIVYIVLTYLNSIIIDMSLSEDDLYDKNLKSCIRSITYLLGFYYSNHDKVNDNFCESIYGYTVIFTMLIVEKYFQNKCYDFYSKLNKKTNSSLVNRKNIIKINDKIESKKLDESGDNFLMLNKRQENIYYNENNINKKVLQTIDEVPEIDLNSTDKKTRGRGIALNLNPHKNIFSCESNEINKNLSSIDDFKKVNDPLSHTTQIQNEQSINNQIKRFKTDLKKFFDDPVSNEKKISYKRQLTVSNPILNQKQPLVDHTQIEEPKARTQSISKFLRFSILDDDIINGDETKEEFEFPNLFQLETRKKSACNEHKGTEIDIKEFNSIYNIDNEEVLVLESSSEDDEQKVRQNQDELRNKSEDTFIESSNLKIDKNFKIFEQGYNNSQKPVQFTLQTCKTEETFNYLEDDEEENLVRTRRRKNASYKKQVLMKYSLEFQIGIKKVLEEIILFLILISGISKLNILSFVDFLLVVIIYKTGNKLKSIFYLACVYLIFFILQYALFTSNVPNISPSAEYNPHTEILKEISENLGLPWYQGYFGSKWGFFFSLGVNRYQIDTLWMDFLIIIVIYFYLELFSFSIFEKEFRSSSNKIAFSEYESSYKILSKFSNEEYEKFKRAMKISFDIEITRLSLQDSNKYKNNLNGPTKEKNYYKLLINEKYSGRNPLERVKEKNKILYLYKTFKSCIYLTFHNYTLIIILIFSMMNNGLISIPYIIFSLVYIYKTHNFLVGNKWTFQHAIRYLLKPILFLDLIGQLVYQIPFDFFMIHKTALSKAMNILGFELLISYNNPASMLNYKAFALTFLKITTYFLVSLQEIIYNSSDFKMFILKYHLKMKEKSKINGRLHSFIFNNSRIMLMNQRLKERKNIDETLKKIELQLTKWNEKINFGNSGAKRGSLLLNNINKNLVSVKPPVKKFTRQRNMAVYKRDIFSNYRTMLPDAKKIKKYDDFSIKKILIRDWLIKICIYLHEQSTLLLGNRINEEENIQRILKGHMNIRSELEELIEEFEKENEDKYLTLNRFKRQKERESVENIVETNSKRKDSRISESSNESSCSPVLDDREKKANKQENKFDEKVIEINCQPQQEVEKNNIEINTFSNFKEQHKKFSSPILEKKNSSLSNDSALLQGEYSKNDDREEMLESTEYYELEYVIINDFFTNYCSRWKIIKYIIFNIIRFFAQNFEYVCYFFMVLNHMVYSCLLTVIWPILVFCVGVVNYPKPRKFFWKLSIIYCGFIICFKFILQISLWSLFIEKKIETDEYGKFNYKDYPRFGIQLFNTTFSMKFAEYIFYDFILMSILLSHQFMLIRKGLWDVIEPDLESVEEAYDRINKNNPKTDEILFDDKRDSELDPERVKNIIENYNHISLIEKLKNYYNELFPRMRNQKPGKDFYVYFTLSQMILIIYIIFFYTKMDQDKTVYNEDTIKLKQFSGNMVIFSFLHVFLIVLERFIYLKNARNISKINYKIYDIYTGKEIKTDDRRQKHQEITLEEIEELKSYEANDRFEIVYFQFESLQKGLIYKYILQIVLVIFVNFYVFWFLPIIGNYNLHNSSLCDRGLNRTSQCNEFSENIFLKFFYFFYCIYFFFSGLQIKYSMVDLRKQSALMKGDNLFYSTIFKSFKAMPFLYELKLLIDWTFTETALDLFKWFKFEAIYDLLFITKCNMKGYYGRRLGTKVTKFQKFFSGGLFFIGMLIIVFGPLVLFSSLNPTNKPNLVTGAFVELQLSFVKNNLALNYTLFRSSQLELIEKVSDLEWEKNKFNENVETKNYDRDQVQKIKILKNSERVWDVTPDTYDFILQILENRDEYEIYLNLKYSFLRQV